MASSASSTESGSRAIWYGRLAWVLLALALLRGLQLLASDPLLAIANNYDMIRVQACIDAWPVRDAAIQPAAGSPAAPHERYRFIENVGAPCFMTSEALFAWAAWPGMWLEQSLRADGSFSIRWKGLLQFTLWFAFAAWCTRRLLALDRSDLAAGHAAIAAVVFADPANLLFFNTFYAESSSVFFLHVLLAGILVAMVKGGRWIFLGIGVAATFLALAKIQHLLVPLLIFLCVAVVAGIGRHRFRVLLLVLGMGALLGTSVQLLHMISAGNDSIRSANLVDTLFTALLPNASRPEKLLAELDLPATCINQSGSSWYTPGMVQRTLCPEVFALDQRQLLVAAVRDPPMLGRALSGGMAFARSWIPVEVGVVEGREFARLPSSIPSSSLMIAAASPGGLFGLICAAPLFALMLTCLRRSAAQAAVNAVLLAVCVLPLFVYVTAVLGDGYVDLSKHFHLGISALAAAVVMAVCLLADCVLCRFHSRRPRQQIPESQGS